MKPEAVYLVSAGIEYDPVTDVLTTLWRPSRPCKVEDLVPVPPALINGTVEFSGELSKKLQTLVPARIRFMGLRDWPKHSSYWLQTSIDPFGLLVPEWKLNTPSLALVFAEAYKRFVAQTNTHPERS